MTRLKIGLQMYTLRSETANDFLGTLRKVAELGYEGVEFAGYGGLDAKTLRAELDALGLQAIGAHVPLPRMLEAAEEEIEYMLTLGGKYIVVPWMGPETYESESALADTCGKLESAAKLCAERGIVFGYHNHAFELEIRLKDRRLLDAIFAGAPSLQAELAGRGIAAFQCYATADLGCIAYETEAREGLVVEEDIIVEIVRPGTGDPLPEGEIGEVVVTTLDPHHPIIRLALGDLSGVMPGASPCGRTNMRILGWRGRADQTTKVRGMFVRPEQMAEIARRHPELHRLRLVVTREGEQDAMTLCAEATAGGDALAQAVAQSLQAVTKLRGVVEILPPGSLPNDGKVIADERPVG